jgi:hypothetical protein
MTDRQVAVQAGCGRGGRGGERDRGAGEGAPRGLREPGDGAGTRCVWRMLSVWQACAARKHSVRGAENSPVAVLGGTSWNRAINNSFPVKRKELLSCRVTGQGACGVGVWCMPCWCDRCARN